MSTPESAAPGGGIFRTEAIAHHADGESAGDILRFDRRWTRLAYRLCALAALAGFIFISVFSIDEYAAGPAVVRIDGRRMINATNAATVESVDVHPGQWVDVGTVLVRLHDTEETGELARATSEFDLQLIRMLRDPNDTVAKQTLSALRAKKDQAASAVEQRTLRATEAGYVSDVRVRPGQHVNPGELIVAVAPKDAAQVSLVALVPADYRPMLKPGQKMRFELDGFRYEYSDLEVTEVSAEAIGPLEVQRLLGQDKDGSLKMDPGAKVLVMAKLPSATFTSEGQPYGYFDGLTGTASVRVRREPLLVTLVPALRVLLP